MRGEWAAGCSEVGGCKKRLLWLVWETMPCERPSCGAVSMHSEVERESELRGRGDLNAAKRFHATPQCQRPGGGGGESREDRQCWRAHDIALTSAEGVKDATSAFVPWRRGGTATDLSSDSQQRGQSIGAGCRWSVLGYRYM